MENVLWWLAEVAGILFIAPGGEQLKYALQLLFPAPNNAVEYEALIHGLNIAVSLSMKKLMVYGDSLVVISQINKVWDCSTDSMGKYYAAVQKLEDKFEGLEFHHMERDRNTAANALSKLGSSRAQAPPGIFVQEISQPSILFVGTMLRRWRSCRKKQLRLKLSVRNAEGYRSSSFGIATYPKMKGRTDLKIEWPFSP
jgi:ribonuclease HI